MGNRALARLAQGEGREAQADRIAVAALAHRAQSPMPVAQAVARVTGADLRGIRVRTGGAPAGEGRVRDGEVRLGAGAGPQVLAHELAHVALGHTADGAEHPFVRRERPEIGGLEQIIDDARRMATAHGAAGMMRWGRFAAAAGSRAIGEVATSTAGGREMRVRYLYTTRCGLIDFRHFYQLMYIALLSGNASAVQEGRDHELHAEATSRFAPEDTVTNALGALFGSQQSWIQRVDTFLANLRVFLLRCGPCDWARMTPAEQDTVVDYYDVGTGPEPRNQNETAMPRPPITSSPAATPTHGIYPFVLGQTGGHWIMYTEVLPED